jgi:transcription antitermination factor NusG
MATITTAIAEANRTQVSDAASFQPFWYAVYTSANHEKKAAAELSRRGIQNFLPLYSAVRRWSDRRVQLELPLFPSYLFVRILLNERRRVLEVPGVATIIGFGGSPAVLPDAQIDILRTGLTPQTHAEPYSYLTAGRRVRVRSGPFAGVTGIVVRRKNRVRLVIALELIHRALAVDIDEASLELLR